MLALVMLITPLLAIMGKNSIDNKETASVSAVSSSKASSVTPGEDKPPEQPATDAAFKVLLSQTGEVAELSRADYLFGAVAAEMPANYSEEALKAQALVCYTFAYRMQQQQKENPSDDLKGADISDNPNAGQGYITQAQAKEKWGEQYDLYAEKIRNVIKAVESEIIVYEDQPILAAFHAISPGETEDAGLVWSESIPYLSPAISSGDTLSPEFASTVEMTQDEFKTAAQKLGVTEFPESPQEWAINRKCSESGTVTTITIGNQEVTGQKARTAFGLRSASFDVEYKEDKFVFTVQGYGHGVGMSQYGAEYMAKQGSDYREIIEHYYAGVSIIPVVNLIKAETSS